MHGRLKVKTTEEQAEAKRKEQQEKLKVYLKSTSKIFDKREKSEHDEEALQLTGTILEHNPDFYTLWNYRREVLLTLKPMKTAEEIKAIASTELNLTQHCLQKNPKSYAAWHHRYWTMEFNPEADWKKELKLCDYFLSQDDRNFHCWDYRRLVALKCKVSAEEELKFTTELLNCNFSNYSAWHYRSTLLPLVHPGETENSLSESALMNELELVHNAAFTDPDDQSSWFYHRWLLGKNKVPLQILSVILIQPEKKLAVHLSKQEKIDNQILTVSADGNKINVEWESVYFSCPASSIWVCNLPDNVNIDDINVITVDLETEKAHDSFQCFKETEFMGWSKRSSEAICSEQSGVDRQILESELEMCQQLLEMEPESKWTLFTSVLLMRALKDSKFQETIQEHMKSLKKIDSYRINYYNDFESKMIMEDYTRNLPIDTKEVNLANKHLSSLYYCDWLMLIEKIDLSNNNLKSVFPLCHLLVVKTIILDNNQLTDFTGLENLKNLKHLSAKNNLIQSVCSIETLKYCENLEELNLDGNPVLEDSGYVSILKKIPALKVMNG